MPVNCIVHEDSIVFRTAPYGVLSQHAWNERASFQIDHIDPSTRSGWSVVVTGHGQTVEEAGEPGTIRASRNPRSRGRPGGRLLYIRLEWEALTGPELRRRTEHRSTAAKPSQGNQMPSPSKDLTCRDVRLFGYRPLTPEHGAHHRSEGSAMETRIRTLAESFTARAHRLLAEACRAPSVFNTQPWAWRIRPDHLMLFADHSRRLAVADPQGRNLTVSCGAALHHLQVAARATGWEPTVERLPDRAAPALLARIRLRPAVPTPSAADELLALHKRTTDRRRFTSWPIPDESLERLAGVARTFGTEALPLTDVVSRFHTELLVARALNLQGRDPAVAQEQQQWLNRRDALGVPLSTVPSVPTTRESHRSRFGTGCLEESGRDVEGSDGLVLLYAAEDSPASWLRCGEALSALWLDAVHHGLSMVPTTQVVEVAETRSALQHQVLPPGTHPLLLVRVGWQAIGRDDSGATPRLSVEDVLLP